MAIFYRITVHFLDIYERFNVICNHNLCRLHYIYSVSENIHCALRDSLNRNAEQFYMFITPHTVV